MGVDFRAPGCTCIFAKDIAKVMKVDDRTGNTQERARLNDGKTRYVAGNEGG